MPELLPIFPVKSARIVHIRFLQHLSQHRLNGLKVHQRELMGQLLLKFLGRFGKYEVVNTAAKVARRACSTPYSSRTTQMPTGRLGCFFLR